MTEREHSATLAKGLERLRDKPPTPRKFIVAVLVLVVLLVDVAFAWKWIAAALGFAGLSSMAGSGLIAEAGRSWGVVR
jgi:hypothetical protein